MGAIAIIDYGAGNLKSVEKALLFLGGQPIVTSEEEKILNADKIILPGVGAFGDAMEKLNRTGLSEVIRKALEKEIPLLGICLGLQLLFESSEESPGVGGLSVLKGKIVRIPAQDGLKVPHIGWNSLEIRPGSRLFAGVTGNMALQAELSEGRSGMALDGQPYVYFVHSYYLQAEEDIVAAATEYGVHIHAAVEKGNLFACQFHPEKSGETGLRILKNFMEL